MLAKIDRVIPIYTEKGTIESTTIDLSFESIAGRGYLPISLSGNVAQASNEELIKLALDELYNQLFPNRAENEKFTEVNAMLAKMEEAMAKMGESMAKNEEAMTKNEERMKVMQGAFLEFIAEAYGVGEETEEITEEKGANENGISEDHETIIEE